MKKNASAGILIESESLKKAGTSGESNPIASPPHHSHDKPLGKVYLKKGKNLT